MRKITLMLLLAGFALFVSPPAWADDVEFYLYRGDANHDGTPDYYGAEIEVSSDATGVQMYVGGSTWVPFANEGGGNFIMRSNVHTSLANLLAEIGGAQLLKISHTTDGESTYSYNLSTNETVVAGAFPADLPVITGVAWAGDQATLSWTWGGDSTAVDGLCVEANVLIGGTWSRVYDECSGDDDPKIARSNVQAVIDFSSPPAPAGPYDLIQFLVGYGNMADASGTGGTAITGWKCEGGTNLFDGTDDEITEAFGSGDWLIVPEPATMCLLLLGLPFAIRRRRK